MLFFTVLVGGLGAAFAITRPAAFSARAVLVVEDARASTGATARSSDAERYVADQVAILESRLVAERASELAGEESPAHDIGVDEFLSNTGISSNSDSNVITISFVADSAAKAQAGAGALGRSYEQVIQAARAEDAAEAALELDKAIAATVDEIGDVQQQIEELRADNAERVELDAQLDDIVASLVELRQESADLLQSPDASADVADVLARVQLLSEELRSRLLVAEVEGQVPGTALLLRQREDAATLLSELTLRRSQIEVDSRLAGNGVAFLAPAGTGRPRGISTGPAVALTSLVGAVIGVGVAYWLSQRRQRIGSRRAPESVLGAPWLADVAPVPRPRFWRWRSAASDAMVPVVTEPSSPRAEPFRVIVGVLMQRHERARASRRSQDTAAAIATPDSPRGIVVAVCSSSVGEGRTMVAVNTALAAGRSGLRTALVDAGFGARNATDLISETVAYERASEGLTEVVAGEVRLEDALVEIDVGHNGVVGLLGRGSGHIAAPELLGSKVAGSILSRLAEQYDVVVIDLPPLLQAAYGTSFVQNADHALVVVRHEGSLDKLRELRHRLDLIGVDALGYVYTSAPAR